jgi:hypothetical protein
VAVSAAAAIAAITALLVLRASRARVDAALASKDVCAVSGIAEKDLGRGSDEQKQRVAERLQACAAQQALDTHAKGEVQRKADEAQEAARLQAELEAKCEALATRVLAGKLAAADVTLAGARAPLLKRIRAKALSPRDLGPDRPELPCEGTRAENKVGEAFVAAAVASIWQWVGAVDPADQVRELLAPRASDMSERARLALGVRAGDAAKRALKKGKPESIQRAMRLCVFADALAVPGGEHCDALKAFSAEKKP